MRYIETKTILFNREQQDLGTSPQELTVEISLDINSIEAFRPSHEDENGPNGCIVYMNGGESFWVPDSYQELKMILH